MLMTVLSFIIGTAIILAGLLGFVPNLHRTIENDFQRRVLSNEHLRALQYAQLALRAGTLSDSGVANKAFVFPPRQDCANADPASCTVPGYNGDQALVSFDNTVRFRAYSVVSYRKSGTAPQAALEVTSYITSVP